MPYLGSFLTSCMPSRTVRKTFSTLSSSAMVRLRRSMIREASSSSLRTRPSMNILSKRIIPPAWFGPGLPRSIQDLKQPQLPGPLNPPRPPAENPVPAQPSPADLPPQPPASSLPAAVTPFHFLAFPPEADRRAKARKWIPCRFRSKKRIPEQSGHSNRFKVDSDSGAKWTVIPGQS